MVVSWVCPFLASDAKVCIRCFRSTSHALRVARTPAQPYLPRAERKIPVRLWYSSPRFAYVVYEDQQRPSGPAAQKTGAAERLLNRSPEGGRWALGAGRWGLDSWSPDGRTGAIEAQTCTNTCKYFGTRRTLRTPAVNAVPINMATRSHFYVAFPQSEDVSVFYSFEYSLTLVCSYSTARRLVERVSS